MADLRRVAADLDGVGGAGPAYSTVRAQRVFDEITGQCDQWLSLVADDARCHESVRLTRRASGDAVQALRALERQFRDGVF